MQSDVTYTSMLADHHLGQLQKKKKKRLISPFLNNYNTTKNNPIHCYRNIATDLTDL